jgi:hypothetical protein
MDDVRCGRMIAKAKRSEKKTEQTGEKNGSESSQQRVYYFSIALELARPDRECFFLSS